jgi:AcrR family transcriptional regulator
VLDVARRVLIEDGLEQFVLRHIAARAEMKLGNLQYYFATRDDLLEAVIRAEFDRDLATFRRDVVDRARPSDKLADVASTLVEHWSTGAGKVFLVLWLLAQCNERFARLKAEIYDTFHAELSAMLGRIDRHAGDEEVAVRARLITALLDGIAVQNIAVTKDDETASSELLARGTSLVSAIATGTAPT